MIKINQFKSNEAYLNNQHTIFKSIVLSFLPGIVFLIGFILFTFLSQNYIVGFLGVDSRLSSCCGHLLSVIMLSIPVMLGILIYESKTQFNSYDFRKIIPYTNKSPILIYLITIPLLILFWFVISNLLAPIIDKFLLDTVFFWIPKNFLIDEILESPDVGKFSGILFISLLFLIVGGILDPLVEELYFRGYLLPRTEKSARKWAPLLSTILFSLYHLTSPWGNVVRIITIFPQVYLVWKKRDIRFSIFTHIGINFFGVSMLIISIL